MKAGILLVIALITASRVPGQVDLGSLLEEMWNLELLARAPEPWYRAVQFSSYDRRSTGPEEAGWFSNSDGFGREPIPGFLAVLRPPDDSGNGLYLLAEVDGPGAVVRTWSAGMGGTLRVSLDGGESLVYEGDAAAFLRRKSEHFQKRVDLPIDLADTFAQEDADYLPLPFGRGLRATWEGNLRQLHFYHLQVRLYPPDTEVSTFDPEESLRRHAPGLQEAVRRVRGAAASGPRQEFEVLVPPGEAKEVGLAAEGPAAVAGLQIRMEAPALDAALRGTLLTLRFDEAGRPQVESPLGDFFGAAPGIAPFRSLPMEVAPDGTMSCRFIMPYRRSARLAFRNTTADPVRVQGAITTRPWSWDARSWYFRAHWRVDHDLDASGPLDLPYLLIQGAGRLVGAAALLMNPSPLPYQGGNWWGEGDEKIFVDGEAFPSFLGTGSEDYFNYSWSRPDLFQHPYCGQPLCTGPGTAGYVSNFRWHILDAIPFKEALAFYLEYWHHQPPPGLSYARIAYHYAAPGALDDHRRPLASELVVPALPRQEPRAGGAASGARLISAQDVEFRRDGEAGELNLHFPLPLASKGEVVGWQAPGGGVLRLLLEIPEGGDQELNLVAVLRPGGARVRFLLDDRELVPRVDRGEGGISLASDHLVLLRNLRFQAVPMRPGMNELVLRAEKGGFVGLDYFWIQPPRR